MAPRAYATAAGADSVERSPITQGSLIGPVRQDGWVSPWSRWSDTAWHFADSARPDSHYAVAVWDFEMLDGSSFLDPQYDELREASKVVLYSLHRWPAMRAPLKAQTINEVSIGMRYWMRWLCAAGYRGLEHIGSPAMQAFEEYLVLDKLNEDLDDALTASSIARYMRAPFAFWEERSRLEAVGIAPLPELPFPGETPNTVATRLTRIALGRIQPLPKEILTPLMNTAAWFIEGPALDVARMVRFLVDEVPSVLGATDNRATRAQLGRYITGKVRFSTIDGKPWHGSLNEKHDRIGSKTLEPKMETGIELARDLVHDVMAAASVLIQGAAGLRISEIEMLEASERDPAIGLPRCVQIRTDDTGTVELFYLNGFLVKTTNSRMPAEWLIGARVVGSTHLPPPVQAINRIFDIARILDDGRAPGMPGAPVGRLFLGGTGGAWSYFKGEVSPLDRVQLQSLQRAFAANYVSRNLLDRLDILRTHAWRKSFAQFVFGVDQSLGPALSQHFKHLQIAMTMEAYVTNDPALLGYLESERAMETARDLYELSTGRQAGAGRLGKAITEHREQILALIDGKSEGEAVAALHGFVEVNQIPFWFLEWGSCGVALAPSEAACHKEAGTTSWRNLAPNFGYRDLDVCSGCSRLLVLRRHLPFWQARYNKLKAAFDGLDADTGAVFRAALRKKLSQAKAVVRALSPASSSVETQR